MEDDENRRWSRMGQETEMDGSGKQGTLIVSGFFGRGNAGDEAMLQCIAEEFGSRFDLVISVDQLGAHPDFMNWHPYVDSRVVHQTDIGFIDALPDGVGMLVGGGGLPIGFTAGQVLGARAKGLRTAIAGVDVWEPDANPDSPHARALTTWFSMFDYVIPRTSTSMAYATACGADPVYGADWALRLPTDNADDIVEQTDRALVILREDRLEALSETYAEEILYLIDSLEQAGWKPVFLPFAPEDERFLQETGLDGRLAIERMWWNARSLKQMISRSGLTVSVGRLHPMIFGAPTRRPVATVVPPMRGGNGRNGLLKLFDMSRELGMPCFDDIPEFLEALKAGVVGPADPFRVAAAQRRLQREVDVLHGAFRRI